MLCHFNGSVCLATRLTPPGLVGTGSAANCSSDCCCLKLSAGLPGGTCQTGEQGGLLEMLHAVSQLFGQAASQLLESSSLLSGLSLA